MSRRINCFRGKDGLRLTVVELAAQVVVVVQRAAEVELRVEVVEQVIVLRVIDGAQRLVHGHTLVLHEVEGQIGDDAVDEELLFFGFGFALTSGIANLFLIS